MSETRSDMIALPADGISLDAYGVLTGMNGGWRGSARREDETTSPGWGFLPGEVTVDGEVVRFWVLPNGLLDSRNRHAIVARETKYRWSDGSDLYGDRLARAGREVRRRLPSPDGAVLEYRRDLHRGRPRRRRSLRPRGTHDMTKPSAADIDRQFRRIVSPPAPAHPAARVAGQALGVAALVLTGSLLLWGLVATWAGIVGVFA